MSLFIFLQAADPGLINLVFMAGIIMVFYFFMIRPQAKKQKEQQQFIDEVEKGDEIVTASGIIGRVNKIEGPVVTLEVSNKTYMRVTKNAISKEMTEALKSGDSEKKS